MMTDSTTGLNAEELMHLSLHAVENNSPEKALENLKRLLQLEPENGKAHYLMGAVHAQIGMHDQAAVEMARALELEPDLHTARFQLGLLHLTSGKVPEAEAAWAQLDGLGEQDALFLFKKGLLHLVRDEFEQCAAALKSGIERNTLNEDLNNDMRRVLQDAESVAGQPAGSKAAREDESTPSSNGRHILLSVYQDKDGEGA